MEAAGLALGALPVAILAVESYQKGLKALEDYKFYPQTLQSIRRNIFIQEQQLQATLGSIGLFKPTVQDVQQRLREIKPDCFEQFMEVLEHMGKIIKRLMDKLEIDRNGKPKWTDDIPERVSWEWTRIRLSFGSKDRELLFHELQLLNNALRNCLEPKREIPSDYGDHLTADLVARFDLKSCDKLRENVQVIHDALAVAWSENCTDSEHPSNLELIWQQKGLNETNLVQLSVPDVGDKDEKKYWQKILISVDTKPMNPTTNACAAPNVPLAATPAPPSSPNDLEKRRSKSRSGVRNIFRSRPDRGEPSVVSLTSGLSTHLDILQPEYNDILNAPLITELCKLIKQKDWNGHLLHTDTMNEKIIRMKKTLSPCPRFSSCSLESAIGYSFTNWKDKHVSYPCLSRRDRLGISAAAVWAVLVLCGTSWLEERWLVKEDITVLADEHGRSDFSDRPKTYPALSHTFTSPKGKLMRPPETEHCGQFQERQIRHKTLFSLGVLLIELGLNKTFHQLSNDLRAAPTGETAVEKDYQVANDIINSQKLELSIGESYANAVQRCIQCHFLGRESTQKFSYSGFRKQFFTGVVAPVQATFDAQIVGI
ncbi:hypothetical protein F5Y14DRAFT_412702 [Nemania sp. NC0429]|nr:hypothetical protein F5Y14DRAFT_412702 [Nemania sp. NC0429]